VNDVMLPGAINIKVKSRDVANRVVARPIEISFIFFIVPVLLLVAIKKLSLGLSCGVALELLCWKSVA